MPEVDPELVEQAGGFRQASRVIPLVQQALAHAASVAREKAEQEAQALEVEKNYAIRTQGHEIDRIVDDAPNSIIIAAESGETRYIIPSLGRGGDAVIAERLGHFGLSVTEGMHSRRSPQGGVYLVPPRHVLYVSFAHLLGDHA